MLCRTRDLCHECIVRRHCQARRETALRRLLLSRLERDLDKEIAYDAVNFAGQLSSLGKMNVVQLAADDGWLTFACRQP